MGYELVKLGARHREIMYRHLLGQKGTDIAHALQLNKHTVYTVVNSPLFQREVARLRHDLEATVVDIPRRIGIIERFAEVAPAIAERLIDIGLNGNDRTALPAGEAILDRVGITRKREVDSGDRYREILERLDTLERGDGAIDISPPSEEALMRELRGLEEAENGDVQAVNAKAASDTSTV